MKLPPYIKRFNWIEAITLKWHLLSPPHRLFIVTLCIGLCFTTALSLVLSPSEEHKLSDDSPSPNTYGLVTQVILPKGAPVELIHFSFTAIPKHLSCPRPITLAESNFLDGFKLNRTLPKGTFLCWSHTFKSPSEMPQVRRGYRIMGFVLSNPEIAPYLLKGNYVDVILSGNALTSIPMDHLRLLKLIRQNDVLTVLLELSKKQVKVIEKRTGLYTTAQILLKSQQEKSKKQTKPKTYKPYIHKG